MKGSYACKALTFIEVLIYVIDNKNSHTLRAQYIL